MCEAVGLPITHLIRTKLAFLTLQGLKRGEYRELTRQELDRLRRLLT
jgi:23S rRNA pseudouridine2605 synthase